jgi:predicted transglutaminase-like cysteine proteinase
MKSLSGVRIVLAAVAVCVALALSLVVHKGASGAVTSLPSTRPSAAERVRPEPTPGAEQITLPPSGFTNFQMRYPDEVKDSAPAFATSAQVALAHDVNTRINKQIAWRETRRWSVELGPRAEGDCVQYALTKRHVLREAGVPDGALRLVIVYAAKYSALHMILQMRTSDDIYVLDSLENDAGHHFYPVAQMPRAYSIVKYQEWGKPTRWMAPAGLVADATPASRRLHSEIRLAENSPWVHSPREQRQATAMHLRR